MESEQNALLSVSQLLNGEVQRITPKILVCARDISVSRSALRALPLEECPDNSGLGAIDRAP